MIAERQEREGWGAGVIPRLSKDLRKEMPGVKGFSERNLKRMVRFYKEYPWLEEIRPPVVAKLLDSEKRVISPRPVGQLESEENPKVPQLGAQLLDNEKEAIMQQLVAKLPWRHNVVLYEKIKDASSAVLRYGFPQCFYWISDQ